MFYKFVEESGHEIAQPLAVADFFGFSGEEQSFFIFNYEFFDAQFFIVSFSHELCDFKDIESDFIESHKECDFSVVEFQKQYSFGLSTWIHWCFSAQGFENL